MKGEGLCSLPQSHQAHFTVVMGLWNRVGTESNLLLVTETED